MNIKESLEALEAIKMVAIDAKKVMADGKVDINDLPVAMEVFAQLGQLSEGIKGLDQVGAEMKDLDSAELQQLGLKVLEILAAIKAA